MQPLVRASFLNARLKLPVNNGSLAGPLSSVNMGSTAPRYCPLAAVRRRRRSEGTDRGLKRRGAPGCGHPRAPEASPAASLPRPPAPRQPRAGRSRGPRRAVPGRAVQPMGWRRRAPRPRLESGDGRRWRAGAQAEKLPAAVGREGRGGKGVAAPGTAWLPR